MRPNETLDNRVLAAKQITMRCMAMGGGAVPPPKEFIKIYVNRQADSSSRIDG